MITISNLAMQFGGSVLFKIADPQSFCSEFKTAEPQSLTTIFNLLL